MRLPGSVGGRLCCVSRRGAAVVVVGVVAVLLSANCRPGRVGDAGHRDENRVGTFRRVDVLKAYYGSTIHHRQLESLRKEAEEAAKSGDMDRVAKVRSRGLALQELAHRQLMGEAPLTNILDQIKNDLPTIAAKAGVAKIVEQPADQAADAESVDVTDLVVKLFEPAEKKTER